jgi:TPR repeat protein
VQYIFPAPPRKLWYKFGQVDKTILEFITSIILLITAVLGLVVFVYDKMGAGSSRKSDLAIHSQPSTKEKIINYADALYLLGLTHKDGIGTPQNSELAVKAFKESADNGNALAQLEMGSAFLNGHGVRKNNKEAQKYFWGCTS